jgi:hypothetical protein
MPATLLRAQLSDHELLRRQHARPAACRTLPDPAATAWALALAIHTAAPSSNRSVLAPRLVVGRLSGGSEEES